MCCSTGVKLWTSTWREFDHDAAYVVCISVSPGFPYMVFIALGFPNMVMVPRHLNVNDVVLTTALLWAAICSRGCYLDVTMIWPLLFYGIRGTPSTAPATRIHGDYWLSVHWLFVEFQCDSLHILWNNSLFIIKRNYKVGTVLGVRN